MRYYSDKTREFFSTEAELIAAEKKYDKKQKEIEAAKVARSARAKEVEDAYAHAEAVRSEAAKKIKEADDAYRKLRDKFVADYGSFHMTFVKGTEPDPFQIFSNLLDDFWHI